MILRRFTLFFFFLLSPGLRSQELLPFVENFTKADYGGDNQVWSVAQGGDNAIYFANNRYLMRYNGVVWEKYALPNKTIIRSVYADGKRIYCGSYKEFGYFERIRGVMRYTSLSSGRKLFEGISDSEEIWKVFGWRGKICFQSFNELFIYGANGIGKIRFPSQVSYCYLIGNELYAATVRDGVLSFDGRSFHKTPQWSALRENVVHYIARCGGITYFLTKNNGIFLDDGSGLRTWNNPLNDKLKSEVIITGYFVDNNRLAIGTALKGLYIVNLSDGTALNINRENALHNNAVLSIAADRENDLWLGLDNGISHIEVNAPVSVYLDNSGLLGSVYALAPYGNRFLLASNHGLFSTGNGNLSLIAGSQGQVWDIFQQGKQYVIGHNDGTCLFSDGKYNAGNQVAGGWFMTTAADGQSVIQANYSGIATYDKLPDLSHYKLLKGLTRPIRYVAQNRKGELWAADNYRGLYRVLYDGDFDVTKVENMSQKSGLADDFGVKILEHQGRLSFLSANKWYRYSYSSGKLVVDERMSATMSGITEVAAIDNSHFLALRSGQLNVVAEQNGHFSWKPIPEKYYQGKTVPENLRAYRFGRRIYVNLDDGFFAFDNERPVQKSGVSIEVFLSGKARSGRVRCRVQ